VEARCPERGVLVRSRPVGAYLITRRLSVRLASSDGARPGGITFCAARRALAGRRRSAALALVVFFAIHAYGMTQNDALVLDDVRGPPREHQILARFHWRFETPWPTSCVGSSSQTAPTARSTVGGVCRRS
jgi:hypothetical protein